MTRKNPIDMNTLKLSNPAARRHFQARITLPALASFGLILLNAAHAADTVYKWTDKDGNVHFSDQPSPLVNATRLTTLPRSSSSTGARPVASMQQTSEAAQKCQDLRDKLVTYKAASTVSETDSLGNTRQFSDDERQKLIALTAQKVQDSCGSGT